MVRWRMKLTQRMCHTWCTGAQLQNTQWENAILSGATFARFNGEWADLKGAPTQHNTAQHSSATPQLIKGARDGIYMNF